MRLFLALPVTAPQAVDALMGLQDDLRIGRLVEADQFHVTLAFLGDVDRPTAEELHASLSALALPPVEVRVRGVGYFGSRAPRLVHAAVEATPPLDHLHRKVVQAARSAGIDVARRRFVPHVTLSRLTERAETLAPVAAFAARHGRFALDPWQAEEVVLFESHLRPGGPVYDDLVRYPLG